MTKTTSKTAKADATKKTAIGKAATQNPTGGKKLSKAARDAKFGAAQRALAAAVKHLDGLAAREAVAALREVDDASGRAGSAIVAVALTVSKPGRAVHPDCLGILLTAAGWENDSPESVELAIGLVKAGRVDALRSLRENGFALAHRGYPLINMAIEQRQAAVLEFAIEEADFSGLDQDGFTPLGFAAHMGNVAAVKRLLREPNALAYGSGFRALQECEGHGARVDAAMTEALLSVVNVNAAPYPYRSGALIELATLCDSEPLAKRVAKASAWGHETAICVAVQSGRLRFAAGICDALGASMARMKLLAGDHSAAVAFAHRRGRAAK